MRKIGTLPIRKKCSQAKKALCRSGERQKSENICHETHFSKVKITKHAQTSKIFRLRRCKVIENIDLQYFVEKIAAR